MDNSVITGMQLNLRLPLTFDFSVTVIGATDLRDPWDASPPTLKIMGDRMYLVFSDFLQLVAIFRCALREAYSASIDLLAEFKGEGKYIVEGNG